MKALPAAGQTGDFLSVNAPAGPYHWLRLTGGWALTLVGAAWAGMGIAMQGIGGALLAGAGAVVALASLAYLGGTLLPFSRNPLRLRLRSYAMFGDRVLLRNLLRMMRLVGDKTDPILRAFVQANNAAVRSMYRKRKPENVLILLPHCVVWTRCPKKVVKDLSSCNECDLCQMEDILGLADRTQLPVGIAIRSSEAYTQARGMGPDLTLAVACDDRLVKGISRVPELPAFGLPLDLPEGSCHDNLVDLDGLHRSMAYFLGPERMTGRVRERLASPAPVDSRRIRLPALPPEAGGDAARL